MKQGSLLGMDKSARMVKAISLWQPHATLVAVGAKGIETRSWWTIYRGPLLIHAARKFDVYERALCRQPRFREALEAAGYADPDQLPTGALVAIATMTDCVVMGRDNLPGEPERSFGLYEAGRYMWVLEDARRLDPPIPWVGAQRLFDVPGEVLPKGT